MLLTVFKLNKYSFMHLQVLLVFFPNLKLLANIFQAPVFGQTKLITYVLLTLFLFNSLKGKNILPQSLWMRMFD